MGPVTYSFAKLLMKITLIEFNIKYTFLNSEMLEVKWIFNAREGGSTPGLGRCPGDRNANPLQYSCLWNPMDSAAWRATVHEVSKESDRTERRTLSPFFHFQTHKTWIWDSRDGKNIMLWTEPRESWWPQKPETQFKAYKRIILMLDRPSS